MMGAKKKYLYTLLLAGLLGLALLWGCGSGNAPSTEREDSPGEGQAGQEEGADADSGRTEGTDTEPGQTDGTDMDFDQIGEFSMEDIQGEAYTQEMFGEYQVTIVNVFTTWCGPCVREIPDLEKLKDEMSDRGVNVVGIVLDAIGQSGSKDPETVEKARLLAEQLEVTYPFLIPDEGYLGGRLLGIQAVPTTFFVDQEGRILGEAYQGSRSLEDWKSIVEEKLEEAVK